MTVRHAAAALACLLGACHTAPVAPAGEPAVIVDADDASRTELRQVVSTALNGAQVTLADDALTTSSVLYIENNPRRTLDDPRLDGRNLGRPERFDLVLDGNRCTLVHDDTGVRWLLFDTECAPE